MSINTMPEAVSAAVKSGSSAPKAAGKTAAGCAEEFLAALKKFDEAQKAIDEENARQRKIDAKARQAKRERDKRINEIYALMAHYKRKLASNPNDPAAQAALSELKTKLFWLMFSV